MEEDEQSKNTENITVKNTSEEYTVKIDASSEDTNKIGVSKECIKNGASNEDSTVKDSSFEDHEN